MARDYAAEYARRIASGAARGLTRAESRGHAEESPKAASISTWKALDVAAADAVSTSLTYVPGPGGKWQWVFVAADRDGKVRTVTFKGGVDPERIKARLAAIGAPMPMPIGSPAKRKGQYDNPEDTEEGPGGEAEEEGDE